MTYSFIEMRRKIVSIVIAVVNRCYWPICAFSTLNSNDVEQNLFNRAWFWLVNLLACRQRDKNKKRTEKNTRKLLSSYAPHTLKYIPLLMANESMIIHGINRTQFINKENAKQTTNLFLSLLQKKREYNYSKFCFIKYAIYL